MQPTQPETVSAFVFCFEPADESSSVGGFSWFWNIESAHAAFDDACASPHFDADNLQMLEVLVPVDVICQGRAAVARLISDQVDRGPGGGVVELMLRERPAKAGAQPCTKPTHQEPTKTMTMTMTMTKTLAQTLHRQLVQLRGQAQDWAAGRPSRGFDPAIGICHNLSLSPASCDALDDLIDRWPAGTGEAAFPVPHPSKAPGLAYVYSPPAQMWNPVHEYARNRLALLDWLIEQTKPNEEPQS